MKYSSVLVQVKKLASVRAEYLKANGWEPMTVDGQDRWRKRIPWGTASEKIVEGGLSDAVYWQARHDGDEK